MVTMSQKEFQRVKVIENAAGRRLSVREAARLLQLSQRQAQDQLLLGNRNRPRHAASAIAVLHPVSLQLIRHFLVASTFQPIHSRSLLSKLAEDPAGRC